MRKLVFLALVAGAAIASGLTHASPVQSGGGNGGASKIDRIDQAREAPTQRASGGERVRDESRARSGDGGRTEKTDRTSGERDSGSRMENSRDGGSSGSGSSSDRESGSGGNKTSGSSGTQEKSRSSGSGSGSSGEGSESSADSSGSAHGGSGSSGSGSGGSDDNSGSSEHRSTSSDSIDSVDDMHKLATRETPEFDKQGFPARRGEVLGFDLTQGQIDRAKSLGFTLKGEQALKSLDMTVTRLRAPKDMNASDALRALRSGDNQASYDLDHFYGVSGYEDGLARTKATTPRKGNLWVGMIDTGVARHPALSSVSVEARDFSAGGNRPPRKHGTAVASILAQGGAAKISSANIFTADGKPYAAADTIAVALDWLAGRGVPVINISLAGPRNAVLDRVVARTIAKGHLVVAAAGNGGPAAPPAYPAAIAGVIAATAVDNGGHIYRYANQGNYVFVAAPGVGVSAASTDGNMATFSGTSFAAPVVAIHLAACGRTSNLASECIDQLRQSARDLGAPGRDPVYGYGLITR